MHMGGLEELMKYETTCLEGWGGLERERPKFVYACKNTPLWIHFIYFSNKKTYCICKTFCIISVLFSTKCYLLHNFISFCSSKMFLINNAPKFIYQPGRSKVKVQVMTTTEHCYFLTVLLYLLNRNRILCTLFIQTTQDNSTMIHINSALLEPVGLIHTAVRYTKQHLCPWTKHCLHKLEVRDPTGCIMLHTW